MQKVPIDANFSFNRSEVVILMSIFIVSSKRVGREWIARIMGQKPTSKSSEGIQNFVFLCIFWEQQELVYYQLLKPNKTVAAGVYRSQFKKLSNVLLEAIPGIVNFGRQVVLLHHKVRPQRLLVTSYLNIILCSFTLEFLCGIYKTDRPDYLMWVVDSILGCYSL